MWKCPECKNEIKELSYDMQISGSEWGTVRLPMSNPIDYSIKASLEDYERDDQETDGDGEITYTCRECDEEINPNNLIWDNEELEEENLLMEENPKAETKRLSERFERTTPTIDKLLEYGTICPKCQYFFPKEKLSYLEEYDREEECPKCSYCFTGKEKEKFIKRNEKKGKNIIKVEIKIKKRNVKRI